MKTKAKCANCSFAKQRGFNTYLCRKHAPITIHDPTLNLGFYKEAFLPKWPLMQDEDWCGDFKEITNSEDYMNLEIKDDSLVSGIVKSDSEEGDTLANEYKLLEGILIEINAKNTTDTAFTTAIILSKADKRAVLFLNNFTCIEDYDLGWWDNAKILWKGSLENYLQELSKFTKLETIFKGL